ncbi:SGS domain-containing protein [Syncephalis pseudoplumigaleata]|uniref:SGS domain-containing protein n=1 Tax=Syncephalis pseudoplumigaleata TaxID=1712513 RepID=A0A4V1J1S4_9FUNG|nr:SGS domain-containing protein [Syncephalis pseudoplumigaleata]|eukprot:RKP26069.1 SGS domain-containing protein [Syncephalis pseudoplumigaleata]
MSGSGKIRHDWYQSDTYVTVEVFAKQLSADDVTVVFENQSLSVNARLPSGSEYVLDIEPLNYPIVKEESSFRVAPSKIEIRLKKAVAGTKWSKLEGVDDAVPKPFAAGDSAKDAPPTYPTSARKTTNWDQLAREIDQEKDAEGDAVNQLFQQIYANADDDTRRAMIKSFTESGGTALSTNWDEVGRKKVDVAPPEGMEERKYEY